MSDREPRLGDVVDDYCSRCRLIMNHGVVGLVGSEIKRVRCNTCLNDHAYRHGKIPRPRKDRVKDLFDEILARIPDPKEAPPAPPRKRSPHLGLRTRPGSPKGKRGRGGREGSGKGRRGS